MPSRRERGPSGGSTFRSQSIPPQSSGSLQPRSGRRNIPPQSSGSVQPRSGRPNIPPQSGSAFQPESGRPSQKEWWPPTGPGVPIQQPPTLEKNLKQRLHSSRTRESRDSSARSTPTHVARARRAKEDALHAEVGRVFKQVEQDVGFNMEDIYHGNDAKRILHNKTPEERGAIPEHARIINEDAVHGGMHFESKRPDTEDAKDNWRQNVNPGLKWWQTGNISDMNKSQLKNVGLHDISSAHPAYFMLRRKNPGLSYVEEPQFRTRSELLAQRKEAMKPDASYDLDGDGVVGVREYYFAARMDKDVSGDINMDEKLQGLKDLRQNVGNILFVDNAGARDDRHADNQYRVIQQDGKIILDQQ